MGGGGDPRSAGGDRAETSDVWVSGGGGERRERKEGGKVSRDGARPSGARGPRGLSLGPPGAQAGGGRGEATDWIRSLLAPPPDPRPYRSSSPGRSHLPGPAEKSPSRLEESPYCEGALKLGHSPEVPQGRSRLKDFKETSAARRG